MKLKKIKKYQYLLQKCRDDFKYGSLQTTEHFWHQRTRNKDDLDIRDWIVGLDKNKLSMNQNHIIQKL